MNNETTNRAATAATSPLTVKEAPQPVMVKKIGKTTSVSYTHLRAHETR